MDDKTIKKIRDIERGGIIKGRFCIKENTEGYNLGRPRFTLTMIVEHDGEEYADPFVCAGMYVLSNANCRDALKRHIDSIFNGLLPELEKSKELSDG